MSMNVSDVHGIKGRSQRAQAFWTRLKDGCHTFDLFFALRCLQALNPQLPRLGHALRPRGEPLRLGQDPSLAFAPATLAEVLPSVAGQPERITVWSFGLYGPHGPLPTHLTEYARERLRQHDDATLARFSDIFHHRLLMLLFRAWSDAQPVTSLDCPADDVFGRYLGCLIGLGEASMLQRDTVPDAAKRFMAGHLSRWSRNPEGLASALQAFFGTPVRVIEFCRHHLELALDQQTRLLRHACNSRLGCDAVLGARVPDAQSKFRLRIGPLDLAQYQTFLSCGDAFQPLIDWVRTYVGIEYTWDYELVLQRSEVPGVQLGGAVRLGWTTWLESARRSCDADDFRLDPEAWLRRRGRPLGAAAADTTFSPSDRT